MLALLPATLLALVPLQASRKLEPGSTAPPLRLEKWLKGEPASPGKGALLVLDVFAPWNEQCIASQPYLSELAREFGPQGVRVVGLTGPDDRTTLDKAQAFALEHAATLDYALAWDKGVGTRGPYLEGRRSLPCTFVIDAQGTVAWIGNPMFAVEPVARLLAGTWDRARDPAALEADERELATLYGLGVVDPAGALAKLAALEARRPRLVALTQPLRFELELGAGRFEQASATGRALVERARRVRDAGALRKVAERLLDPARPLAQPDLALARLAGEHAVELTAARDHRALELLARVHHAQGDTARAVELLTQAIQVAPPLAKANLLETLQGYQSKPGG